MIEASKAFAGKNGIDPSRFEFQMLIMGCDAICSENW